MRRPLLAILALALAAAPLAVASPAAEKSWDAPAFSLDPRWMASAAAAAKAGEGEALLVLHDAESLSFSSADLVVHTRHVILRVLTREGLEGMNDISWPYEPWRDERPTLRARVVSADGKASSLDQATISEQPQRQVDRNVYSDARLLIAPLPNLAVGSVVEYEAVTRSRPALAGCGSLYRAYFGGGTPVLSRRLTIEHPSTLPVRWTIRGGASIETASSQSSGRTRLVFRAKDLAAIRTVEEALPPDAVPWPCIDVSTGTGWGEVARAYAAVVEEAIADGVPAEFLVGISETAGADGRAAVEALLARIRQRVRYTGVNFGENAIVPHPPRETLERGYGDCKDQAVLLVAALRAAGVVAVPALLRAGSETDLLADRPGFGLFNHAIVYLPDLGLWVDPTAELMRAGEIPSSDQGRLALLVTTDTTALQAIPETPSSACVLREVREYRLAELGYGNVLETTTLTGEMEAWYRQHFGRLDAAGARSSLERYANESYGAGSLGETTVSDTRNLDEHFALRLEAKACERVITDEQSAVVIIPTGPMLSNLPAALTRAPDEGTGYERSGDVLLDVAHVTEWECRVIPPRGFRPAPLPADRTVAFGPARLEMTFRAMSDGSVSAHFRFDSARRRYTAAEAIEVNRAAQAFFHEDATVLSFEQVGETLLAAGQYREALDEFNALVAAQPAAALPRIRVSRALLAAGFGTEALREARRTLEVEPDLARAHSNLAWVLLHDGFGRQFGAGADLSAAREAYRRAAELEPDETQHTVNLGILWEYNDALVRYGPGARLEEAVAVYRGVADKIRGKESWDNYALDLFKLGRMQELRDELRQSAKTTMQRALLVASVAALDGASAAQQEATARIQDAEDRRAALAQASEYLLSLRRYGESADLLTAATRGTSSATQSLAMARLFRSLPAVSASPPDETTAKGFMVALMRAVFLSDDDAVTRLLAPSIRAGLTADNRRDLLETTGMIDTSLDRLGYPPEMVVDLAAVLMETPSLAEGSAVACLPSVSMDGAPTSTLMYLTTEDGRLRLVDSGSEGTGIAREMLAALDAGRLADARSWITLLRTQRTRNPAFPDGKSNPLCALLPETGVPAESELRLAAAYALGLSSAREDATLAVPLLQGAWQRETGESRKQLLARSLARALSTLERSDELLVVTEELVRAAPDEAATAALRCTALDRVGKSAQADEMVRAGLTRRSSDLAWQRLYAERLTRAGKQAEAVRLLEPVIVSGNAQPRDVNNYAWAMLYLDQPDWGVIDGHGVVQRLLQGNASQLHTLACVLGEAGRMMEGREVFWKYLDARGSEAPDGAVWLAYGILAECFGLRDVAMDSLAKVEPDPAEAGRGDSVIALARRIQQRLRGTPPTR